jgi:hypothetical protein
MRLFPRRRVVIAVLATALVAETLSATLTSSAQGTASPWAGADPNAVGGITFFDATGQAITSGSTNAPPFAKYAQGRTATRAGDTKATLTLYKPQEGVNPAAWSQNFGIGLSTPYPNGAAPSPVKDTALPVNTGGADDTSLDEAVQALGQTTSTTPGYVNVFEVRLNTSAPQKPEALEYDYADIAINSGTHTWTLVYTPGTAPGGTGAPGTFSALAPTRLLDTRVHNGGSVQAAGGTLSLQVAGRGGVPASGVSSVVLNVTVVTPGAAGYLIVYPGGTTRPTVSNLNFAKGQTVPNLVVAPVGADGKVNIYNGSGGTVQILADVSGYFNADAA